MAADILTTASTIMCPHGGQVLLTTSNTKVLANRSPALIESDIHAVTGCSFTVGQKYSPCIKVEWSFGSIKDSISGTNVLTKNSIGKCYSSEGALQGLATIVNTQMKDSAQ